MIVQVNKGICHLMPSYSCRTKLSVLIYVCMDSTCKKYVSNVNKIFSAEMNILKLGFWAFCSKLDKRLLLPLKKKCGSNKCCYLIHYQRTEKWSWPKFLGNYLKGRTNISGNKKVKNGSSWSFEIFNFFGLIMLNHTVVLSFMWAQ